MNSLPYLLLALGELTLLAGCESGEGGGGPKNPAPPESWEAVKAATAVYVALSAEFGAPYRQPLSGMGWEDGLFVSRDGLALYCLYLPADGLAHELSGLGTDQLYQFKRGPTYGMDLTSPVPGNPPEFIHGDILYATRSSTGEPFSEWKLSAMARWLFTEGAPQFIYKNGAPEVLVFTSNDTSDNKDDIRFIVAPGINPSGLGTPVPSPISSPYAEDNPHLERLGPQDLVLLFESRRPGGSVWHSTSATDGASWSPPAPLTSVPGGQPHLWHDGNVWWLYYTDGYQGKPSIYRARQGVAGNWDSWINPQLVVGAGNAWGVGEPTLTQNGDLSFVVVYENPQGTSTDRYDCDPWFLPRK